MRRSSTTTLPGKESSGSESAGGEASRPPRSRRSAAQSRELAPRSAAPAEAEPETASAREVLPGAAAPSVDAPLASPPSKAPLSPGRGRRLLRGGKGGVGLKAACALAGLALLLLAPYAAVASEPEAIDLNTASAAELASLPGIGPAKAQAILSYREATPFRTPEDLLQVKGIGEHLFAQLKDRIRVGGAPTSRGTAPAGASSAPRGHAQASAPAAGGGAESASAESATHRAGGNAAH